VFDLNTIRRLLLAALAHTFASSAFLGMGGGLGDSLLIPGLRRLQVMSLPMTFDDVSYFGNQYRGDLVITHGIIYYFPHVNVALENKNKVFKPTEDLGLIGIPLDLLADLIRELRSTTNKSRLREAGLWRTGESSQDLQARLDAHIAEVKKQPPQLFEYEFQLPKPMRFAGAEIRNLSMRGGLRFDTEYDNHDFSIGFHRKKLLREALSEGGFSN
jgi:hypothetical protein